MKYKAIEIKLSQKAIEHLETFVQTGCFGRTIEETAQRMVESFIRREIGTTTPQNWITYSWDKNKTKYMKKK